MPSIEALKESRLSAQIRRYAPVLHRGGIQVSHETAHGRKRLVTITCRGANEPGFAPPANTFAPPEKAFAPPHLSVLEAQNTVEAQNPTSSPTLFFSEKRVKNGGVGAGNRAETGERIKAEKYPDFAPPAPPGEDGDTATVDPPEEDSFEYLPTGEVRFR